MLFYFRNGCEGLRGCAGLFDPVFWIIHFTLLVLENAQSDSNYFITLVNQIECRVHEAGGVVGLECDGFYTDQWRRCEESR